MNPMGALDDICRLLASGKNVVSTAVTGLIYPRSLGDKVVDKLETACATGQSSFHATGIEPGWAADVLPLTMSGLFQRIDSLLVQELMDYTSYDSADMLFDIMGFGKAPDEPVPMADAALAGVTFRAPLMLLADGLGATIDEKSPPAARTKPIKAAWAPPCMPCTPSLRCAQRHRESVRSLTFR